MRMKNYGEKCDGKSVISKFIVLRNRNLQQQLSF